LLTVKLDKLVSLKPQEIHDQLQGVIREDEAVRMDWRARKKDGAIVDLEVIGSRLDHEGRDQVLVFCREAEALPQTLTATFRERGRFLQTHEPNPLNARAGSRRDEFNDIPQDVWANLEEERPDDYAENFDREAKKLIKRIEDAMTKVERYRRGSGNRPNL
jgi:hypothetical protein